jgi:hypothetical protein
MVTPGYMLDKPRPRVGGPPGQALLALAVNALGTGERAVEQLAVAVRRAPIACVTAAFLVTGLLAEQQGRKRFFLKKEAKTFPDEHAR